MSSPVYHFGDFRLDPGRFELLRKDHRIRLERKPLDLLILLASSDGRLVTRTEIAERLWDKEVFVDTEHGINTAVRKIRAVLRDDPEDPRFVQTVTGRGYRFIGPVEISGDLTTASASSLGQPPDPITPDLIREVPDQVIPIRVPQQQPRFHRILIAICSTIFLVALAAGFVAYNRHRTASALRTAATAHSANTSGVPAADHAEAERDYLQGRYLWYGRDYDGALLSFRRATELDPEYALPWTGLSIYYGAAAIEGQLEPRPALLLSRTTAQKAAALDPNLPEAHLALAAVAFAADWRWQDSLRELDRAVQLDPKFSEAYHFRAKVLAALGRHDEAIEAQRRAIALDPFARPWALSYSYLLARRYDLALTEAQTRIKANQDGPVMQAILSDLFHALNREPESMHALANSYLLSGDKKRAEQVQQAFKKGGSQGLLAWRVRDLQTRAAHGYVSPVEFASLYARLGNKDQSLQFLEQAYEQHSPMLLWVENDSDFDFLHNESRYRHLIHAMGLPEA